MANPQPTPFVQFSKELFDALLLSPMPATHKEIVLAVIRRTYGDHGKKSAPISIGLLVSMTGRSKSGLSVSLAALIAEGVIRQVSPPGFGRPAVLGLNKNYEKWGRWSVDPESLPKYPQDGTYPQVQESEQVQQDELNSTSRANHGVQQDELNSTSRANHGIQETLKQETSRAGARDPVENPAEEDHFDLKRKRERIVDHLTPEQNVRQRGPGQTCGELEPAFAGIDFGEPPPDDFRAIDLGGAKP